MSYPQGTPEPGSFERMAAALEVVLDPLAERIAALVVQKLCAEDFDGYVDQHKSVLGPRRHVNAIRSGALPGFQIGRRYLARDEHIEQYMAQQTARQRKGAKAAGKELTVDELALEMGFVRKDGRR
jgi:hypothetical protein